MFIVYCLLVERLIPVKYNPTTVDGELPLATSLMVTCLP